VKRRLHAKSSSPSVSNFFPPVVPKNDFLGKLRSCLRPAVPGFPRFHGLPIEFFLFFFRSSNVKEPLLKYGLFFGACFLFQATHAFFYIRPAVFKIYRCVPCLLHPLKFLPLASPFSRSEGMFSSLKILHGPFRKTLFFTPFSFSLLSFPLYAKPLIFFSSGDFFSPKNGLFVFSLPYFLSGSRTFFF